MAPRAKTLDIPLSTGPIRVNSDEHYVLSICEQIVGRHRRRTELARYRIELVEISSEQLAHRGTKLLRDAEHDLSVLRPMVEAALP